MDERKKKRRNENRQRRQRFLTSYRRRWPVSHSCALIAPLPKLPLSRWFLPSLVGPRLPRASTLPGLRRPIPDEEKSTAQTIAAHVNASINAVTTPAMVNLEIRASRRGPQARHFILQAQNKFFPNRAAPR